MDEYFEWKANHAIENALDEETSLNRKSTAQPTAATA
jgi:hypothetical protein